MSWIDTTLQQIFANKLLVRMAGEIDRDDELEEIAAETERLTEFVNQQMWDDGAALLSRPVPRREPCHGPRQSALIGRSWRKWFPRRCCPGFSSIFEIRRSSPGLTGCQHYLPTTPLTITRAATGWEPCGLPPITWCCAGLSAAGAHDLAHEIAIESPGARRGGLRGDGNPLGKLCARIGVAGRAGEKGLCRVDRPRAPSRSCSKPSSGFAPRSAATS